MLSLAAGLGSLALGAPAVWLAGLPGAGVLFGLYPWFSGVLWIAAIALAAQEARRRRWALPIVLGALALLAFVAALPAVRQTSWGSWFDAHQAQLARVAAWAEESPPGRRALPGDLAHLSLDGSCRVFEKGSGRWLLIRRVTLLIDNTDALVLSPTGKPPTWDDLPVVWSRPLGGHWFLVHLT